MSFITELTLAKNEYDSRNYESAFLRTSKLISSAINAVICDTCSKEELLQYLELISLHQLLSATQYSVPYCTKYNKYIQELHTRIYGEKADYYNALHWLALSDLIFTFSNYPHAETYISRAFTSLTPKHSKASYAFLSFLENVYNAKLSFSKNDYYEAIRAAEAANALWHNQNGEQLASPCHDNEETAFAYISQHGIQNLVLLCNSYGKINNPDKGISLLEHLLTQHSLTDEQTISVELTLAELYLIAGQQKKALSYYEKYSKFDIALQQKLYTSLANIAHIAKFQLSYSTEPLQGLMVCCSQDSYTVSFYNAALVFVSHGYYEIAMFLLNLIKGDGYSMYLALLAMQNKSEEIDLQRTVVNNYFYQQINQIISHYQEEVAYNHLAKLQYHIDLVLNAYCSKDLSPSSAYDFLLNTKYIALETSFLKKLKKERRLYSTSEIMEHLDDNTVLLEYTTLRTITTTCYGVFVVSKNDCIYLPLGDADTIDTLVSDWLCLTRKIALTNKAKAAHLLGDLQKVTTRLKKLLYLPLKSHLPTGSSLLIAPAGSLANYPFSQLAVTATKTLEDYHFISYLNTGKELLYHSPTEEPPHNNTAKAVIISNPAADHYTALPNAEKEANFIASLLPVTVYQQEEASLSNVLEAFSSQPDLLHVATHGIFQSPPISAKTPNWDTLYQSMCNSGIVLADGLLSCAQISTLDCNRTKLAVLSCCYSGTAAYLGTEGVYGLRRSCLLSGCHALILNLWEVDDTASFLWMKTFYEAYITSGLSIKEAHHIATQSVKNYEVQGIRPYANPYFWAGFILVSSET